MKHAQSDIQFLITVFSLFIVSVALLHITKGSKAADLKKTPSLIETSNVTISTQDILDTITPYIMSHSIITLAKTLTQFSSQPMLEVVTSLVKDDENLSAEEKVQLILALAFYSHETEVQYALFDLLVQMKTYLDSIAVLLVAAHSENPSIINDVRTWTQQHASQFVNEQLFEQWTDQALDQAVTNNDLAGVELLSTYNIHPTVKKAAALLLYVVQYNKDSRFIPFLVRHGANVNEITDKKTPLMLAVANRNKAIVQALLDAGADPNIMTDPEVGTALQIAFERNYIELEELLRNYGAR